MAESAANGEAVRTTVVVVPRERWSKARESLESVLRHTTAPHRLVYVDGNSPRALRRWLDEQAAEHGFTLVRRECYLSPNEARNIGLAEVDTEYVAFVDNDVHVCEGWLEPLIACADESGAALVGPLVCDRDLETVHCAGGTLEIVEESEDGETVRRVKERMGWPFRPMAEVGDALRKEECSLTEYHAVLARREVLERIGGLDEQMLNSREHLDICLEVMRAGGTIWFEPASVVIYLTPPPLKVGDIHFYAVRWSDEWERRSLERFREKWDLTADSFFRLRFEQLGWRRREHVFSPILRRLTLGRRSRKLEELLTPLERRLNRRLSARNDMARAREEARAGARAD